jgi:tetratricopeptide (TPR) repeat protein
VLLLAGIGAVLLVLALALRRRHPLFAFAVLWMAACLVPSSTLVPLREMVVDHRAYLGGAGVLFALGSVLWAPGRGPFAIALLAFLAARGLQYQRVIGDPVRAWEDAVTRAPHAAEAWRGLGEAYAAVGDARAEWALQEAVRRGDSLAQSWANLGVYYLSRQRRDEALYAMQRAAQAAPRDARIRDNLGALLEAEGRKPEAIVEYEAALRGVPPLAQPRIRLALLVLEQGDAERARRLLDEAARLEIDAEDARAIEAARARLP